MQFIMTRNAGIGKQSDYIRFFTAGISMTTFKPGCHCQNEQLILFCFVSKSAEIHWRPLGHAVKKTYEAFAYLSQHL